MKRRGFLATAVAALAAPFAMVCRSTAQPADETTPIRVEIDWYKAWGYGVFWLNAQAKIRYRYNDGDWQVKQGPLPLQLEKGFAVEMHQGTPTIVVGDGEDLDASNYHVTFNGWKLPIGADSLGGDFGNFSDPEETQKLAYQLHCKLFGRADDAK